MPLRPRDGYLAQLREGWRFLIKDRLLVTVTLMIAVTNLLDIAKSSVFLPVWAVANGHGVVTVGLLLTCFAVTAMISSLVASAVGSRLPRRVDLLRGLRRSPVRRRSSCWGSTSRCGRSRLVYGIAGLAAGFLNPMLGAIFFERIPQPLLGRVGGLADGVCWAGVPFGGLVAAGLIALTGLTPALIIAAGLYAAATLLPALASRASFDPPPNGPAAAAAADRSPGSNRTSSRRSACGRLIRQPGLEAPAAESGVGSGQVGPGGEVPQRADPRRARTGSAATAGRRAGPSGRSRRPG